MFEAIPTRIGGGIIGSLVGEQALIGPRFLGSTWQSGLIAYGSEGIMQVYALVNELSHIPGDFSAWQNENFV
jgi:hypothetical protein